MAKTLGLLGLALAVAVAAGGAASCGSELPPPPADGGALPTDGGPPTLTQIQSALFTPKCAGCHDGSAVFASLDLRAGASFGAIVNVPSLQLASMKRVNPGDLAHSYLLLKLLGTQIAAGGSGERMPFGGPYLDTASTDAISSWIASDAPNN